MSCFHVGAITALAGLVAFNLAAAPPGSVSRQKKPSEWTDEERIAARTDPVARNARVAEIMRERNATQSSRRQTNDFPVTAMQPADVVYRSKNPELLMRTEILATMIHAALAADDAVRRHVKQDLSNKGVPLGLPPDFLGTIEFQARDFITLQRTESLVLDKIGTGRGDQSVADELQKVQEAECPALAQAVQALRNAFGGLFDRFLYEVAAPGVFFQFDSAITAQQLRRKEAGCR